MSYFGTDGIRGIVDKTLNKKTIQKLAKAIVKYYQSNDFTPFLLIGNDTRISSDYILSVLSTTLLEYGVNIDILGSCSSPCLAFIAKKHRYPLALMISASHNTCEFNGLKLFNSFGEKVSTNFEKQLEKYMDSSVRLKKEKFGIISNVADLKLSYIEFLKSHKKYHFPCIIDCANGGTSSIVKSVFAKYQIIKASPDGTNINDNCGCTQIEFLRSMCMKKSCIGFALDGDGDRIHVVNKNGDILSGDKLLYILSKFYLKRGDNLICTIYNNLGLEQSLKKHGIMLIRTDVGDKCIVEKMRETHSVLGGEDSGHIIIKRYSNTGDGLLNAILIGNILHNSKLTIEELLEGYAEYYQANDKLNIENAPDLNNHELQVLVSKIEEDNAKVIMRRSGTEPVFRIMVEHESKTIAIKYLKMLKELIKSLI